MRRLRIAMIPLLTVLTVLFVVSSATYAGSIAGQVWLDQDRDGIQDPGEMYLQGVLVFLLGMANDGQPELAWAVTDYSGTYAFDAEPGTYYLKFHVHPITVKDAGFNDSLDSDVNPDGFSDLVDVQFVGLDIDCGIWEDLSDLPSYQGGALAGINPPPNAPPVPVPGGGNGNGTPPGGGKLSGKKAGGPPPPVPGGWSPQQLAKLLQRILQGLLQKLGQQPGGHVNPQLIAALQHLLQNIWGLFNVPVPPPPVPPAPPGKPVAPPLGQNPVAGADVHLTYILIGEDGSRHHGSIDVEVGDFEYDKPIALPLPATDGETSTGRTATEGEASITFSPPANGREFPYGTPGFEVSGGNYTVAITQWRYTLNGEFIVPAGSIIRRDPVIGQPGGGRPRDPVTTIAPNVVDQTRYLGKESRKEYMEEGSYNYYVNQFNNDRVDFLWQEITLWKDTTESGLTRQRMAGRDVYRFLRFEATDEQETALAEVFWEAYRYNR